MVRIFLTKNKMLNYFLTSLYEYEINVNRNIQKQFEFGENFLRTINDYLDPSVILNIWIPLLGGSNHKLLVQLVSSLGLINALASVIKWVLPETRPVWWLKEGTANFRYNFRDIKFDPYSCDTSAGFPSTHVTAFMGFLVILAYYLIKLFLVSLDKHLIVYGIFSLLSAFLMISRLYFLYEFLHQCIAGAFLAAPMLYILKSHSQSLMNYGKLKAVSLVVAFGLIPISGYFSMLYLIDADPFWSVRMAFKWCADPLHLKHESSPVFTLCRDFGYLMGVALSCPLAKSYNTSTSNYRKRLPLLFIMEMMNAILRSYTPKQYGRFAFVAYEFLRNCCHSFMLLSVLPKI